MNPHPQGRAGGRAPVAEDDDLDLRLPAHDGGNDDDDRPWEDDEHGIGQSKDGSEDVGLDAAEGSDEPIDIVVRDDDEATRWTEGSDAATDVDADPDLLGGAEDGWTDGTEPVEEIDMGVEVDDEEPDDESVTRDGGEEGPAHDGAFDGISQLPPLDAGSDDEADDRDEESFARELLLEAAGGTVADDDVLVDAAGRAWSRARASGARVELLAELEGLVARERSSSCLTREDGRVRWWSSAADGTLAWSDDCGQSWRGAGTGPRVLLLCSDGEQALAMLAQEGDGGVHLQCSSDGGRQWMARALPDVAARAITAIAACRDVVVLAYSTPAPKLFASVAGGAWRELGLLPPFALLLERGRVVAYACASSTKGTPLVRYPLGDGTPPWVATVLGDDAAAPLALCGAHRDGVTALHVWTSRAWSVLTLKVESP